MKNDNNSIDALELEYLYYKLSQIPESGNGLYTAIDIYQDETIAIYKGEILNSVEAKKRAEAGNDKYFLNLLDGNIMDSMYSNCMAKYANDAKELKQTRFKNNTEITLDDNNKVCIKALRDIKAGEEIFCSYGKRYWKKHS